MGLDRDKLKIYLGPDAMPMSDNLFRGFAYEFLGDGSTEAIFMLAAQKEFNVATASAVPANLRAAFLDACCKYREEST